MPSTLVGDGVDGVIVRDHASRASSASADAAAGAASADAGVNDTIIQSITCPITADIMRDPVQGNDGQTYEREAIVQALSIKSESPITRAYMTVADLQVNSAIRFLCDKYHAGQLGPSEPRVKTPPKISTDKIAINHSVSKNSDGQTMLKFGVDPESMPSGLVNGHLPQDLVVVLDRSGSTNQAVEATAADGNKLENGMSILDIVKHGAATLIQSVDPNSRVAIVVFDDRIEIVFELMPMTEMNRTRAIASLTSIQPRNSTNIWGATEKAIQILNDREDKSRAGNIVVLTDGSPNVRPARGEVETLKRLRKSLNFTSPIYMFGFGYNLERSLLYDMAKHGGGGNGHICDGGMIATVFCHSIATILSTVAVNLQLHITYGENVNFIEHGPVMGDFVYNVDEKNSRQVVVDLGTILIDQARHIIMNTEHLKSNFKYCYTYKIGGQSYKSEECVVNVSNLPIDNVGVNSNVGRFVTVEMIREIINLKTVCDHATANAMFEQLEAYFTSRKMSDKLSQGILANINGTKTGEGQIKLAVTNNAFFLRWGEFYLDQLSRSLNQENKPNFRDPACPFGGDIFEKLVDKSSDVFDTIPPPTPSRGAAPPRDMSSYNSQSVDTSCFTGTSLIVMADGSRKCMADLKKGDSVCALSDPYNMGSEIVFPRVVCILKTVIPSGKAELVTLGDGLKITRWHPVLMPNGWEFPEDLRPGSMEDCDAVYSVLLDGFHNCMINNIWCIGLGHGYDKGILAHEYFGTERVVDDMRQMDGWDAGCVVIEPSWIMRDSITTRIIGLRAVPLGVDIEIGADGMSMNMAAMVQKPLLQM